MKQQVYCVSMGKQTVAVIVHILFGLREKKFGRFMKGEVRMKWVNLKKNKVTAPVVGPPGSSYS